jgi:hypothetical protein
MLFKTVYVCCSEPFTHVVQNLLRMLFRTFYFYTYCSEPFTHVVQNRLHMLFSIFYACCSEPFTYVIRTFYAFCSEPFKYVIRTFYACCSEPITHFVQNLVRLLFRTFYAFCSEPFTHFAQNLCPGGSGEPTGALAAAIQKDFGSFEAMKNQLSTASVAVQVSCSFFHQSCGYR